MAKNTYETLLIIDSNHYARDPGGISTKIDEIVTQAGGNVLVNRLWMEQKLAYSIDKHQKGTYWLTYFEIEGVEIPKINLALKLYESVVRHLIVRLEPRLIEPILANARGESVNFSTPTDTDTEDASTGGDKVSVGEPVAVEA